jgi:hypothetical protein
MMAFLNGQANRGKPHMVFDWDTAARLIVERGATEASAGLSGDWEWTGGQILRAGAPVPPDETHVYLASTWAPPELEIDGQRAECWKYEAEVPGWDSDTYWPESAKAVLAAGDES